MVSERLSERLEDLSAVKARLSRQWNVILHILQNDIPNDIREYLHLYSLLVQERLQRANNKALANIKVEWDFVKRNTVRARDASLLFLQNRWKKLQPRLDNLVQTSFAISTATSTLQLTVQVTPILLSALTILATAPIFNALLPEFLFNTTVLFFIMMGISSYAGYSKFKELETRAKLDGQIAINQRQTLAHSKELRKLSKQLRNLENSLNTILSEKHPMPLRSLATQSFTKRRSMTSNKAANQEENAATYRKAASHKR